MNSNIVIVLVVFLAQWYTAYGIIRHKSPADDNNIVDISVNNQIGASSTTPSSIFKIGAENARYSDPDAEYYKGPITSAELDRNRERDERYGLSRPDPAEHRYGSGSFVTASSYGGYDRNRDRISVNNLGGYGQTGNSGGSGGGYYGNTGSGYGGYNTNRNPYGPPQPIDYRPPYNQDDGYRPRPYDVYENGLDWGHSGYGNGYNANSLWAGKHLSKEHLLPIAGAALLGIAAALVANPVLLQLGVSGKRKRRDIANDKNLSQDLAYSGQKVIKK